MTGLLETCGFTETQAIPLTGGVVSIYQGSRPLLSISPQEENEPQMDADEH